MLKFVQLILSFTLKLIVEDVFITVLRQMALFLELFQIIPLEIAQIDALLLQIITQITLQEGVSSIVLSILRPLQIIPREDVFQFVQNPQTYMEITRL